MYLSWNNQTILWTDVIVTLCIVVPIDVSITGTATLDEFETLTLTCIASPPATMTWRFSKEDIGGRVLSPEHYTNSNPDDAPQNTSTSTVMIRGATQAHSGFYTCVANNGATRLPATEVFNVTVNGIITYVLLWYYHNRKLLYY